MRKNHRPFRTPVLIIFSWAFLAGLLVPHLRADLFLTSLSMPTTPSAYCISNYVTCQRANPWIESVLSIPAMNEHSCGRITKKYVLAPFGASAVDCWCARRNLFTGHGLAAVFQNPGPTDAEMPGKSFKPKGS